MNEGRIPEHMEAELHALGLIPADVLFEPEAAEEDEPLPVWLPSHPNEEPPF